MARFCTKCGMQISEGSRFCTRCGTAVGSNVPPPYQETPTARKKDLPAGAVAGVVLLVALALFWFLKNGSFPPFSNDVPVDADPSESEAMAAVPEQDPPVSSQPPAEETSEPEPEPTPTQVDSNYYILPQSSQRLLTYVDIENFTKQDMMLARNEIFARHGRMFNDEEVRGYFEAQSWYHGTIAPEDFSTEMLSDIEQKNITFIKQYEDGINGISQPVGNSGSVVTYNGYMIPQSSSRRLTYTDIAGLNAWQLSIARNEIYARHGRMFNNADIRAYFEAQPWYRGYIAPDDFDASVLSATEQYNISFIQSYE